MSFDMNKMLQEAQRMQAELAKAQEEAANEVVEASAGGGMVTVTMAGNHELLSVRIAPEVVKAQDGEMLEDLVRAAINEANRKIEEAMAEKVGALRVPGF